MTTETKISARDVLKSGTNDEILKAHKRDELEDLAAELGLTADTIAKCKTKQVLLEQMIEVANLPDPGLRGMSEVDGPVSYVWHRCAELAAEADAKGEPRMRRKDVIALLVEEGVAFYTARTQYQSWFAATGNGSKPVSEVPVEDLPKKMRPADEEDEVD